MQDHLVSLWGFYAVIKWFSEWSSCSQLHSSVILQPCRWWAQLHIYAGLALRLVSASSKLTVWSWWRYELQWKPFFTVLKLLSISCVKGKWLEWRWWPSCLCYAAVCKTLTIALVCLFWIWGTRCLLLFLVRQTLDALTMILESLSSGR